MEVSLAALGVLRFIRLIRLFFTFFKEMCEYSIAHTSLSIGLRHSSLLAKGISLERFEIFGWAHLTLSILLLLMLFVSLSSSTSIFRLEMCSVINNFSEYLK